MQLDNRLGDTFGSLVKPVRLTEYEQTVVARIRGKEVNGVMYGEIGLTSLPLRCAENLFEMLFLIPHQQCQNYVDIKLQNWDPQN